MLDSIHVTLSHDIRSRFSKTAPSTNYKDKNKSQLQEEEHDSTIEVKVPYIQGNY